MTEDESQQQLQAAFAAFDSENFAQAETLYQQIIDTAENADHRRNARHMLGFVCARNGNYDRARTIYEALLNDATTPQERHRTQHQLGMVARMAEDYDTALSHFEAEADVLDEKNHVGLSANAYERGIIAHLQAQYTAAKAHFQNALDHANRADDAICRACAYRGLGDAEAAQQNYGRARQQYQRSLGQFQNAGDTHAAAEIQERLTILDDSENTRR